LVPSLFITQFFETASTVPGGLEHDLAVRAGEGPFDGRSADLQTESGHHDRKRDE